MMRWLILGGIVVAVGLSQLQDDQAIGIGLIIAGCFAGLYGLMQREN